MPDWDEHRKRLEEGGKKQVEKGKKQLEEHGKRVGAEAERRVAQGRRQVEQHRRKLEYYRENREKLLERVFGDADPLAPVGAGIIVLAPILFTLLVVDWLFSYIVHIPGNELFNVTPYFYLNQSLKLALLLAFGGVLATVVGRVVQTEPGFRLERALDDILSAIPFLGTVYDVTKVTAETLVSGADEFQQPVKMDVADGLRLTAFKTGHTADDGRPIVFLPTAPNITSGLVIEADKEMLAETDETVEDALTRILSAGFAGADQTE